MSYCDELVNGVAKPTSHRDQFRYPAFEHAMNEYMDIADTETRRVCLSINEADQAQMLVSLTGKLYDHIVEKVDDIDYGSIPASKGDITKIENYEKMVDCLEVLRKLLIEYKQPTETVDVIRGAITNVVARKSLFMKAYKLNAELPIVSYNNICLAIISAESLLISSAIEFIKTPSEATFTTIVDKVGLAKSKEHLLFNNLKRFNKACATGDFDKAMEGLMGKMMKAEAAGLVTIGVLAGDAIVVGLLLTCILPLLRELVYFFFYTSTRLSDWFNAQADLLQMNAYNVEYNSEIDSAKKDAITKKQFKLVELFRKVSNKLAITSKNSEVKTNRQIVDDNKKKYKTTDISDDMYDSASTSLF